MEQFPSFSILENILQNILSFRVWCHRNLSQSPVTPVTVWAEQLLTQDPGLMFDWNVYPGPGSVELLGNHKPRHGLHNPCGRGWLSRVSWHYWGSLDIRDNDNTHATLIWEEHVCDGSFHTRDGGKNEAIIGNETGLTLLRWAINIFLCIENMPQS